MVCLTLLNLRKDYEDISKAISLLSNTYYTAQNIGSFVGQIGSIIYICFVKGGTSVLRNPCRKAEYYLHGHDCVSRPVNLHLSILIYLKISYIKSLSFASFGIHDPLVDVLRRLSVF